MTTERKPDEKGTAAGSKYCMTISRITVDKLGVKLYDKVSAVIAELVANGYDADAEVVTVEAPMGVYLSSMPKGKASDNGYTIVVRDNGHGMPPEVVNDFYLTVGKERRNDAKRGDVTRKHKRRVMGRKGVGKLAPFGICNTLEVVSSGGKKVAGTDRNGKPATGYKIAHFVMKLNRILANENENYEPDVGEHDGRVQDDPGTTIIMKDFNRRRVPEMETLSRQLAQRFGIAAKNWKIKLVDTQLAEGAPDRERKVGDFDIATMPRTKIIFEGPVKEAVEAARSDEFKAVDEDGTDVPGAEAGFFLFDKFYPVIGWVAYAMESYRDDLMAGIRIYCRGKIAAQTAVFNRKSGFTGEHNVRSYLVGELHADWLDDEEDLIQTDRRDILWSEELGQKFEEWGRKIVAIVGKISRAPVRKKAWEDFDKSGNVMARIETAYPGERWKGVRDTTIKIARLIGERLRPIEVGDEEQISALLDYSLALGPHITLDDSLSQAASDKEYAIAVMATILRTARVAELSSYGMIAEKRVKVIEKFQRMNDEGRTQEVELQLAIEEAPWLINPLWSPITANQSLATLRKEFEKFYEKETGEKLSLEPFNPNGEGKRPDFVLTENDNGIQIVEIKRSDHTLSNDEWDRIHTYIDLMRNFLDRDGNEKFKNKFGGFTVTLVCDKIGLKGAHLTAFEYFKEKKILVHITWSVFLMNTKQVHQEFLYEAAM